MRIVIDLLVAALLAGCGSKSVEPQAVAPKPTDPLLGEWVSDGQQNVDGVTTLTFMAGGTVDMNDKGKAEHMFYRREPVREWDKRKNAELAKSHPDVAKKVKEYAIDPETIYGRDTEVILLSKVAKRFSNSDMTLMFSPSKKSLMIPMMVMFVRPGHEKRYSQRKDDGDGSKSPFAFLAGQTPLFADRATGDWGYSWKADWAVVLKTAAKELRAAGFESPGRIDDTATIAGKYGVTFYNKSSSENVSLSPKLRSQRVKGKWITTPTPGWVTVHVAIKVKPR